MGGLRLSDLGTWSSRLLDSGTVGSGAQGLRITGVGGQGLSGVGLSVGRFRAQRVQGTVVGNTFPNHNSSS